MKTGVECEFFLLDAPKASDNPNAPPRLGDHLDTQGKPCYDAHALMRRCAPLYLPAPLTVTCLLSLPSQPPFSFWRHSRYDYISALCSHMEAMGWGPYQADHEDASGQFEINWDYDDALVTADRVVFFKWARCTAPCC